MTKNIFRPVSEPDAAMQRFNVALRRVMHVSKDDLNRRMEKEKASREGKPKRGPKPKRVSDPAVSILG
jgi:hypothetical protein